MHILAVEDDPVLGDALARSLTEAGYAVDWVQDGLEADQRLTTTEFDAVILDLGLPRLDGLNVLRRLRKRGVSVPVLILTARDAVEDRVGGLDLGADDYLVKPFNLSELEARLRALVRRYRGVADGMLEIGRLRYDLKGKRVYLGTEPIDLSARELAVFETLILRAGRVVSKEQIVERLGGTGEDVSPAAIEVYIHRLRKKLENSDCQLRTIRGLGYLLEKPRVA